MIYNITIYNMIIAERKRDGKGGRERWRWSEKKKKEQGAFWQRECWRVLSRESGGTLKRNLIRLNLMRV